MHDCSRLHSQSVQLAKCKLHIHSINYRIRGRAGKADTHIWFRVVLDTCMSLAITSLLPSHLPNKLLTIED